MTEVAAAAVVVVVVAVAAAVVELVELEIDTPIGRKWMSSFLVD